jgi:hypothetical protein
MEQLVEWELAQETEVHGENPLPTTNPMWADQGFDPGRCDESPATDRLSCGTAVTVP